MLKIEEQHLVEPCPERGRTGNVLIDSDVEVRKDLLACPTPPSSRRRVIANFDNTGLAGSQTSTPFDSLGVTENAVSCGPTPIPSTTPVYVDAAVRAGVVRKDRLVI